MRGFVALSVLALALTVNMAKAAAEDAQGIDVSVAGFPATLTVPTGADRPPVVLIIAGSGPTDRDGNSIAGVKAGYLSRLAGDLAAKGIASLRYDKRGVAGSKPANAEQDLAISTFVDDAAEIFDWLSARQDIGPIVIVGHSEGGLIALELAKQEEVKVAGVVLLATPGRPLAETLRDQVAAYPEPLRGQALEMIGEIEAGGSVTDVPAPLLPIFRPSVQPYLRSVFALRPAGMLADLKIPALVIGGGTDIQVSRADFDALSQARPGVESRWFARMNHVLVDAPADRKANIQTYLEPVAALSEGLVDTVADFVTETAKASR